ncbi:unnamed protein product [Rhizoctonia solani]|uniref:Uncharacterized protein n=1 Tax=Rhizoctonia solani TaxID=456999 RepID=A0A8H3DX38_9AGAM|nr:unnamed protein product [Rhizoctonia solani]
MINIHSISIRALVRAATALRRSAPLVRSGQVRNLHVTDALYKKKQTLQNGEDDDAFGDQEDLFASPNEAQAETKSKVSAVEQIKSTGKLEARRSENFKSTKAAIIEHPAFKLHMVCMQRNEGISAHKANNSYMTENRVSIKRLKRMNGPKRALLVKLITIAATRAELLEFIDIFKVYRQAGWSIDDLARVDFISRCIHLRAPDIALAILYHRPIFGFDIPTLTSGRALMRSLLSTPHPPPDADQASLPEDLTLPTETPLTHALLLANLFDMYALPPAESDKVTRALLLGASAQQLREGTDTEDANAIIQLIQETAENQRARPGGLVLNGKDPRVKGGKLVATSQALKERGKITSKTARARTAPLYSDQLTISERTWVKRRLDRFVDWAQEQGQDATWVDKLKVT